MITVKVFFIGRSRYFVEFENNKDRGFHIVDNCNKLDKLITKRIYNDIKNFTGSINYHKLEYSKYFESITPQQIINL